MSIEASWKGIGLSMAAMSEGLCVGMVADPKRFFEIFLKLYMGDFLKY
jgi:hypothetical protein